MIVRPDLPIFTREYRSRRLGGGNRTEMSRVTGNVIIPRSLAHASRVGVTRAAVVSVSSQGDNSDDECSGLERRGCRCQPRLRAHAAGRAADWHWFRAAAERGDAGARLALLVAATDHRPAAPAALADRDRVHDRRADARGLVD